jgi:hypothetical protein
MRDDMDEIIIERPRYGSRMGHHRRGRRVDGKVASRCDPDALPFHIGMKRAAREMGPFKSLNENLRPLRRYLESQVNRPWNKVWSEISANLRVTSAVQQHVRDHVPDFVATQPVAKDGAIWVKNRGGRLIRLKESDFRLYVDPRTGLLRRNKRYKSWTRRRREEDAVAAKHRAERVRELAPDIQLHRFDNRGWWEVRLSPIPVEPVTTNHGSVTRTYNRALPHTDVVRAARLSSLPGEKLYGRLGVYASAKRQLSRKEMLALDLPR